MANDLVALKSTLYFAINGLVDVRAAARSILEIDDKNLHIAGETLSFAEWGILQAQELILQLTAIAEVENG